MSPFSIGQPLDDVCELEVLAQVLAAEARAVAAEVALVELFGRGEAPREKAPSEGRVGDEPDPELNERGHDPRLEIARPQRVLALQRGYLVHGVRASDRLDARLGEADVADLALRDQLGHGADGVLDRRVGVDAVLVVEVDVLDAETPQRSLACASHVRGRTVDRAVGRVGFELDAELGRQEDLVAAPGDRTAHEFLVGVRAVHVGGVEEVAAEIERAVDRAQRFAFVGCAIESRHAHTAETDGRDRGSVRTERACVHVVFPSLWIGWGAARILSAVVFPLNLPNVLTVLRIMLVPVLVVALLGKTPAGDVLAAVVFALASLTDFVDGYLARARDSVTAFGKLMDPLADKLLVVAALITLVSLHRLAAWVAMVIITRELSSHCAADGREPGRRGGRREHARKSQDLPADSRDPRDHRGARSAALARHAALRHGVRARCLSGLDFFFGVRRRMQKLNAPAGS